MKKISILSKSGLITLWVLCLLYQHAQAQTLDPYTGIWEGNFMEQFKTAILLDQTDESNYSGKILMYSGENQIQDDELSKITLENRTLSFYIPAKETSFQGTFNEMNTELSGNFIFPDNSKHPLIVRKYEGDSLGVKPAAPSLKESLKLDIPVDELKSDFKDLINKLKQYHPRLYSYTSMASFQKQADEILAQLNQELSLEQFYLRIAPLIESVKCSHTGIRLPRAYMEAVYEKGNFFPQKLFIRDMRAWHISTPGKPAVKMPAGCEILSINNRPVKEIIKELLSLIPSEGNCMTTKYQELNRNFHTWFYLLDQSTSFKIEYFASGSYDTILLDAIAFKELEINEYPGVPYSFSVESNPEYAVLRVNSFGIRDTDPYFGFLDSAFRQLKSSGLSHLVLDLRGNQGGHPIFAAQLFFYLTDENFTWFQRNPDVEEFEPLYNNMQPSPEHYRGNIYVLVNGACLSTTGHLIAQLKSHTTALFIGEEPGSSYYCNDFSIQLKLPNSGMEVNIPRTTFVASVSGFSEGLAFPVDYNVSRSVNDILGEKDCYFSLVQKLIVDGK